MVRNYTNHQPIGASYRNALAAGRSLVTPRSKALKAFCKGMMWITYQQPVDNSSTLYSKTTERQILPVIIAGYRQILPVLLHYSTYLLGLQAGMETAIYVVSF